MSRHGAKSSPFEAHTEKLLERWEQDAELWERRGLDHMATFLRSIARELEAHTSQFMFAELSLTEAATEGNVAYNTMQQWVAQGQIRNQGRKGAPKVRRCDLPQYGGKVGDPGTFRSPRGRP